MRCVLAYMSKILKSKDQNSKISTFGYFLLKVTWGPDATFLTERSSQNKWPYMCKIDYQTFKGCVTFCIKVASGPHAWNPTKWGPDAMDIGQSSHGPLVMYAIKASKK